MRRRFPPLNALRVFESASRLSSVKHAANELHVTPAAISHQIKLLESFLQIKLFKRRNRKMILTELGKKYSHFLQEIFNQLNDETEKLMQNTPSYLTLSSEPSFAMHWLIPRLNRFKKTYPDIDLRISASYEIVDLTKTDIDVGIRWGEGNYPNLYSTLLFRNEIYPVCHPTLLQKHPITTPNDLKHHVLLHEIAHSKSDYPDWYSWLKETGVTEVDHNNGLFFETGYLLIQAALDGQGVALAHNTFVEPAIKAKRLIRLFDMGVEPASGYYLVFLENRISDPKIKAFRNWLKSETAQM